MPAIGLGTFGSDHVTPAQVAAAVRGAAQVGYRAKNSGLPPSCGTTSTPNKTSFRPAANPWPICDSTTSTFTWCTGHFPTSIRPVAM